MADQRTRPIGAEVRAAKDRLLLTGRDLDRDIARGFASSKWWWLAAAGAGGVLLASFVKPRRRAAPRARR